jgi:glyoxylase-like metal-dependent hydrolase (beta-lactamase superfamily II)
MALRPMQRAQHQAQPVVLEVRPLPGVGMTDPLDAYGDALRRALHDDADAVNPAHGLDEIRARTGAPTARYRWVLAIAVLILLLLAAGGG